MADNQGPILGADVVQGLLDRGAIREDQAQRLSSAPQQSPAQEVPATPIPEAEAPEAAPASPEVPPMLARQPEPQAPEMIARPEDLPDAPEPGVDFGVNLDPREIAGEAVMEVENKMNLKAKEVEDSLTSPESDFEKFQKYLQDQKEQRWSFQKGKKPDFTPEQIREMWPEFKQNLEYERAKQSRIQENENEALNKRIADYTGRLKDMVDNGWPEDKLPRDPELDRIISERAKASEAREVAAVPTEGEIQSVADVKKKEAVEQISEQRVRAAETTALQRSFKNAEDQFNDKIKEIDNKIQLRSPAEVFGNASTAGKIGMLIAAAASGIAYQLRGGQGKTFVDRIQEQIDNQIKEERLSEKEAFERRLEMERLAIQKAQLAASRMGGGLKQQKMALEIEKLADASNRRAMDRRVLETIRAGRTITMSDIDAASPRIQERAVQIPREIGGGVAVVDSKEGRTKLEEGLKEASSAFRDIDNIISNANDIDSVDIFLGKLGLDPEVGGIETALTGLVGKLRIPFTGPGVLTDTEFARLQKAIGNPVGWTSMSPAMKKVQIKKLKTVQDILKVSMQTHLETKGARIRLTDKQRLIMDTKKELKAGGMSDADIMDSLIEKYMEE